MGEKTKKDFIIRVKNSKGYYTEVVRERYLKDDISCRNKSCPNCEQENGIKALSKDVTHFIVPDCQASLQYLDIFESDDVSGVIFMQTCVEYVKSKISRRHQKKFQNMLLDARQDCIVFNNEFHKQCYVERKRNETRDHWKMRLVYEAVVWYYEHLNKTLPVIIISDNIEVIGEYSEQTLNVFVMSMRSYLEMFYSNNSNIHEVYESLNASLQDDQNTGDSPGETVKEFKDYLPISVLEARLRMADYIQGVLRVNKFNLKEAFVRPASEGISQDVDQVYDIIIPSLGLRNRAIHGDQVVVKITSYKDEVKNDCNSSTKKGDFVGRVVGVLQRNWRDYVACFDEEQSTAPGKKVRKTLVIPYDHRIPKIRVSTTQIEKLKNERIIVRIDNWKSNSLYPSGHFIRSLGPIGDLKTECSVILVEHSLLSLPFTEAQLREMPKNEPDDPWIVEESEVEKRKDLRNTHLIFSIDPKGCEDVDDTLSVRELDNGDVELGVHIADVTHFVKSNSLTDLEARTRSTTVYLADRRFDMLPSVLSSDLCSLLSDCDRYAVSVLWILDDSCEVKDVWYGKTIIRSQYKLFYEMAQSITEQKTNDSDLIKNIPELKKYDNEDIVKDRIRELRYAIKKLMEIARNLKSKRIVAGALELDGVEVQVQIDENKEIEDLVPKKPLEVHETIAECMIFANHWVAKRILRSFPSSSLLRRHPLPRQDHFTNLKNCAKSKGFDIDTSSNKSLALSLDSCVDPNDDSFNKILRFLTIQAMSNALYFSTGSISQDQYFHYGLALDRYTHFTSPIRRYADIVVHRQLMMAIGYEEDQEKFSNQDLEELTTNMNTKHRESKNAQTESVQLFQALYFRGLTMNDELRFAEAVIYQTRENGFLVTIERYGITGPVFLRNNEGYVVCPSSVINEGVEYIPGKLSRDETTITVSNNRGTFQFKLFDHVKVYIGVSESRAHGNSIKLELASCYPYQLPQNTTITKEDIKLQKQQLIQNVKDNNEEKTTNDDVDDDLLQLKTLYGQTHKEVSLYYLLDNFKELSLQE